MTRFLILLFALFFIRPVVAGEVFSGSVSSPEAACAVYSLPVSHTVPLGDTQIKIYCLRTNGTFLLAGDLGILCTDGWVKNSTTGRCEDPCSAKENQDQGGFTVPGGSEPSGGYCFEGCRVGLVGSPVTNPDGTKTYSSSIGLGDSCTAGAGAGPAGEDVWDPSAPPTSGGGGGTSGGGGEGGDTCPNGATDFPTCTDPGGSGTCTNGGTDYPTCTAPVGGGDGSGTCTNGGTNYPTCTAPGSDTGILSDIREAINSLLGKFDDETVQPVDGFDSTLYEELKPDQQDVNSWFDNFRATLGLQAGGQCGNASISSSLFGVPFNINFIEMCNALAPIVNWFFWLLVAFSVVNTALSLSGAREFGAGSKGEGA
jgi:hypothetical protein